MNYFPALILNLSHVIWISSNSTINDKNFLPSLINRMNMHHVIECDVFKTNATVEVFFKAEVLIERMN